MTDQSGVVNYSEATDEELVSEVLRRFAAGDPQAENAINEVLVGALAEAVRANHSVTHEPLIEHVGGNDPRMLNTIRVKHGRRTAKSVALKNFGWDSTQSGHAFITGLLGTPAIGSTLLTGSAGLTFLPFVVGVAVTILRAYERPVEWAAACLLFLMHEAANGGDFVSYPLATGLGQELQSRFSYAKGASATEVQDLLDKLEAVGAIRARLTGYEILEKVVFVSDEWD